MSYGALGHSQRSGQDPGEGNLRSAVAWPPETLAAARRVAPEGWMPYKKLSSRQPLRRLKASQKHERGRSDAGGQQRAK
ncbi:hypothetical protein D9M72_330260 [compost metagenome]